MSTPTVRAARLLAFSLGFYLIFHNVKDDVILVAMHAGFDFARIYSAIKIIHYLKGLEAFQLTAMYISILFLARVLPSYAIAILLPFIIVFAL